jgi:hypothetical protein
MMESVTMLPICRALNAALLVLTWTCWLPAQEPDAPTSDAPAPPAASPAEGTHLLRYKFAPEDVLEYDVDNDTTINVQVGDVGDAVTHNSHSRKRLRVLSRDDVEQATVEVSILYVTMFAKGQGQEMSYDSRKDDKPPENFVGIHQTIGRPWGTMQVSPLGAVSEVKLSLVGVIADQPSESAMDVLPLLPEQPVAVSGTWKEPFEIEVVVEPNGKLKRAVKLQRVYSLRAVEAGVATIDLRTVVLSPIRDAFQEGQLVQRKQDGTLKFHIERGVFLERSLNVNNRVVGFQGPQTTMSVINARKERLVSGDKPDAPATAANPEAAVRE